VRSRGRSSRCTMGFSSITTTTLCSPGGRSIGSETISVLSSVTVPLVSADGPGVRRGRDSQEAPAEGRGLRRAHDALGTQGPGPVGEGVRAPARVGLGLPAPVCGRAGRGSHQADMGESVENGLAMPPRSQCASAHFGPSAAAFPWPRPLARVAWSDGAARTRQRAAALAQIRLTCYNTARVAPQSALRQMPEAAVRQMGAET